MNLNNTSISVKDGNIQDEDYLVQNCYNPYIIAAILFISDIYWMVTDIFMAISVVVLGTIKLFLHWLLL